MMSLYVRQKGSPDAEAIVFLHGGGLSSAQWIPQFELLPEYYCVAPDLPEQGKSADLGPFTLAGAALQVAEIIRTQVPRKKAHVVGISAGAAVALRLLRDTPQVVERMFVSGAPARVHPFLARLNDLNEPVMRWLSSESMTDLLIRQFRTPVRYRELILEGVKEGKATFIRHYDAELTKIVLPERAVVPLLITVGEKETGPAKHFAQQLVREIQGSKGAIVSEVGHFWCLENVDLFSETVRAWISGESLPGLLHTIE